MEILKHFPPSREFRQSLFRGFVETEESKERTRAWKAWMEGYSAGMKDAREGALNETAELATAG